MSKSKYSFNVNTSAEAVKDSGSGNRIISESGYYSVEIVNCWITVNDKGARSINLKIKHEDIEQYLFNAFRLDKNDGTPAFGHDLFNKFTICCGIENLESTEVSIKIGKETKTCDSFVEFDNKEVILKLVANYSIWNGKLRKDMVIREIYRITDNATAQEIVNAKEYPDKLGSKFTKDSENKPKNILGEGVTEKMVEAYEEEQRSSSKSKETTSIKPSEQSSLFDN